jgi:hypothetical protein
MTLAHRLVYVIDDDLSMRKAIGGSWNRRITLQRSLLGRGSSLLGLPIPAPHVSFSI